MLQSVEDFLLTYLESPLVNGKTSTALRPRSSNFAKNSEPIAKKSELVAKNSERISKGVRRMESEARHGEYYILLRF